ncbi:hypothetical protein EV183_003958 [Coemansia sp. RSA 2336]|nr:hypothetical protein EV183_003958 [Coemansia sp. RSA 2336]
MQYNYPNDGYYQDTLDDPYQFNYNDQMFAGDLVGNFSTMATPGLTPVEPFQSIEPATTRKKARKPRETRVKSAPRPKTPWSLDQNQRFFRTLAEYIYVDKTGLKPLAIYLNQQELDHVDHCENSLGMSDIEIAQSLSEQEAESNPNRCGHLLFEVLRHMQRASGVADVRAVNEKAKNVRSRIINRFISMYDSGALPPKRPVRYVAAILSSLTASPFCPVSEASASVGLGVYSTMENKHDVCLWLQAMMWLYPRKMYDFLLQCSTQIARTWVEDVPMEYRKPEDFRVLNDQEPDIYSLVELLRRMVNDLSDEPGASKHKPSMASYYTQSEHSMTAGKKRKRKLTLQETKQAKDENATVVTNDEEQVSVGLFDLLKTKEKLKIAGMRNKMLAAVGGVVRNGHANTMVDIKYHLYRLWTCVARFAEVSKMLVPSDKIPANSMLDWPRFAEFVVVHDYLSPFDAASVEPRLRVSKSRMVCKQIHHNIEDLIKQWVASTEGETRMEIPIWLVIAQRSDNQMVLGLVISSLDTNVGGVGMQSLISSYRRFDDASLMPVIDTAIVSGGSKDYNNLPMHDQMGLDPWPWSKAQEDVIAASDDFKKPVNIQVGESNAQLVVSSAYADSPDILDPWLEPRVMPSFVFNLQKTYASEESIKSAPEYAQLLNEEYSYNDSETPIKVKLPSATSTSNNAASSYNNIWKQIPTMPLNSSLANFSGSLGTLAPQDLTTGIHDMSSVASVAALNAAGMDYNINGYNEMPSMLDSSNLMMDSQPNFPVNMLNGYVQNEWGTVFDPNNPYPQVFNGSEAPSEYGPP